MVAISKLLSAAVLVTTDVDLSVSRSRVSSLESKYYATTYRCINSATPGGGFTITQANAVQAMTGAPINTGRSGYPHEFTNQGGTRWHTYRCNNAKLLEFPVLLNGRIYNANSRPEDNPGPARVVYTLGGQPRGYRLFCGVVAHAGQGGNPNAGYLNRCV